DLYNHGRNEIIVGDILRKKRQDVIISTKVGNVWDASGDSWHWDASKKYIMEAVKKSLVRLGTDYIDLYQLHGGTLEDNFEEIAEAFEDLKREGVIRQYGISSIRPNVIEQMATMGRPSAIMMQYSALDRRPEEWFEWMKERRISVISRGTIAKGLLTNEWEQRMTDNGFLDYSKEELAHTLKQLEQSTDYMLNGAIGYNLKQDVIASTVLGVSSLPQLYEIIDAYHHPASQDVLEQWMNMTKANRYEEHRMK
ncbi:MAG: aldo/keto reductase, partial [Kurthia sp.]|nr:aldo/keto reductase [Kurthia sp.]